MGSETDECERAVGISRTSSFLFFPCENSLIEQNGRRESARGRSLTSKEVDSCACRIRPKVS